MIHGVDVSSWQAKIDWNAVAAAGADFAIVKLTEGNGATNKYARAQIDGARCANLIVLAYHFARPNGPNWSEDAHAEAELCSARNIDGLFTFLDVERNEPLTESERPRWREWCDVFRSSYGRLGFYSYGPFLASLTLDPSWTNTLLWLARYPIPFRRDCSYGNWPTAVRPWARADIWQHGGDANDATWPGIEGPADVNTFAGSKVQLLELLGNAR